MKVVAVCFALSLAMLSAARLVGPSDHEAAKDVAADAKQAREDARKAKRSERWERAVEASFKLEQAK